MFRRFRYLCLAGLVLAALAACATTESYENKLNAWLGKSEKDLVAAWGVPDKQYQVDPHTKMVSYLAHHAGVDSAAPAAPAACADRERGDSAANSCSGGAAAAEPLTCETLFTLVDGAVKRWGHRGNDCRSE